MSDEIAPMIGADLEASRLWADAAVEAIEGERSFTLLPRDYFVNGVAGERRPLIEVGYRWWGK